MKSRILFINKGILRNDIKSMGWIAVTYFLGLLCSIPLRILMIHSQHPNLSLVIDKLNNPYLRIFQFDTSLQLLLMLVMPVLTGLLLFRYLQTGNTSDMIHSLPIKRETLYNTHLAAGFIFLLIPVIITALISWAIVSGLGIEIIKSQDIFSWLGIFLLMNLLLFITTAAVGMVTGLSSVQAGLSYILLLLPAGLSMLVLQNMHTFIYGFAYDHYTANLSNLSPLFRLSNISNTSLSGTEIAVYLLCCAGLYLLGRYLYQRRQLEMAGDAITFASLKPVFKYGVTFCSMLVLGSYFNSTQGSMSWTCFGYLLGSLLGYFLSEILLNKSIHVFRKITCKGYLVYCLVIIVLFTGINYDVIGFEKRLPELSQVKNVYWDSSFYQLNPNAEIQMDSQNQNDDNYKRQTSMIYSAPENISIIYNLNKSIIANCSQEEQELQKNPNLHFSRENICLAYRLKSGKIIYRQYNVTLSHYRKQLKPFYESQERKLMVNDILHITPQNVDLINITANEVNRNVKITDPALVKQAITVLQKDIRQQTYEDLTSNRPEWAQISVLLSNGKRIELGWNKSYTGFGNWLKTVGEYNNARVIPANDIKYVLIEKIPTNKSANNAVQTQPVDNYPSSNNAQYLMKIEQKGDYQKITDPQQIEICLDSYSYPDNQLYNVLFVLKTGDFFGGGFSSETVPGFAKS